MELSRPPQRKESLRQLIRTIRNKPKVIMLQETLLNDVKLTGYKSVCKGRECGRGLASLVDKKGPFIEHELLLGASKIEYTLVEVALKRQKGKAKNIFCLNVYSSPKDTRQSFRALFNKTLTIFKNSPTDMPPQYRSCREAVGFICSI